MIATVEAIETAVLLHGRPNWAISPESRVFWDPELGWIEVQRDRQGIIAVITEGWEIERSPDGTTLSGIDSALFRAGDLQIHLTPVAWIDLGLILPDEAIQMPAPLVEEWSRWTRKEWNDYRREQSLSVRTTGLPGDQDQTGA